VTGATVVKIGGSLLDWPPLPDRLASYLRGRRDDRLIVIVGGGRVADVVRGLDRVHGLGDVRAHRLALRALDLTAHLLAALVPGCEVVDRLDALAGPWERGRIPVLAPRRFLDEDDAASPDPLRASWDVTTDSIAARVAVHMAAEELALLKSAPLPPGADRRDAARLGLVDPAFPDESRRIGRVTYLNLRDPTADAGVGGGEWRVGREI
jgi:5-(aminomethyl)-3-furanmethanol phosphate kinase